VDSEEGSKLLLKILLFHMQNHYARTASLISCRSKLHMTKQTKVLLQKYKYDLAGFASFISVGKMLTIGAITSHSLLLSPLNPLPF
jgi:hypothetical protein